VLSSACPILIVPAMNERMWLNAITQNNVAKLKEVGMSFAGPIEGVLACGVSGVGHIEQVSVVCEKIEALLKE